MKGKWQGATTVFLVLAIMLIVGACANSKQQEGQQGNGAEGTAGQTETTAQASEDETATTREYTHMAGTSVIPVKPQRVVTDWYYGQLVALGLKPVGTDDYVWKNHPFIEQAGTESIGGSMEKIIELKPDLIISWGADKYEQYSKIAPAVPLELSEGPVESVRTFGDLLGRQKEAEDWIKAFEATGEAARQRLADKISPDETFTIFTVFKKELKVYGFVNMGGYPLYEVLKVKAAPKVEEIFRNSKEWNKTISFEAVPEFAGDHIILTVYDPNDEGGETLKQLQQSEVWKSLDAVKNERVHVVKFNDLYNDDPVAVQHQVDLLADLILKENNQQK
ncbi:ABC transporter substrate-binding protein [Paenibacillus pinihumi]|uniref:ABC transporter substrate-binding protein n=1 Tax=Paenibacillus pinihumi TaxID=669462 RepID=UPI00042181A4|nr:ABC transporter substrate-binding protein [Paenibacillus pinihumi]